MKEAFNEAVNPSVVQPKSISGDFNRAATNDIETPSVPRPEMHYRPDATTIEAVHRSLERDVSPQLREMDAKQEFRRRMTMRRDFNRAAKGLHQKHGPELGF